MKNIKGIILSLGLITTTLFTSTVFAEDRYKIDIDLGDKYNFVAPFQEGMAMVGFKDDSNKNVLPSNLGYINEKGEEVIPVQYTEAKDFNNGVALVKEKGVHSWDGHNGFIDKNGNTVVPFKYYYLQNYSDGLIAFFDNGTWGFLDINGNIVIENIYEIVSDFENGVAPAFKDKKWGLIDTTGKTVIPFEYGFLMPEGDRRVVNDLLYVKKDNKFGLINKNNEIIIPIKYDSVTYIGENMAEVGFHNIENNTRKYGIVNSKGEEIVPIKYENCEYYRNGLLMLKENGKYGAVDKDGNIVIPFEYKYIRYLEDKADTSQYVITAYNFEDSMISYLDKNGEMIKTEYTSYGNGNISEGLITVEKDKKVGYVDADFNVVIEPMYYRAGDFSEGLAIVINSGGLSGYINKTGEIVVPMIYDTASNFQNGQGIVSKDKNYYFISLNDGSHENVSDVPKVILNGELLEFPTDPVIIDGTTYVPIRKIAEGLGGTVIFEPNTKNTLVQLDEKVLSFNKNNNAIIKDDTMLIPVRYISESFGAEVLWEQSTKTVNINQK